MKKILLALVLIGIIAVFYYRSKQGPEVVPKSQRPISVSVSPMVTAAAVKTSSWIFIPYWNVSQARVSGYDRAVYFGVDADENGIVKTDDGYKNIDGFLQMAGSSRKLLAVRMIDSGFDSRVLDNPGLQRKIIADTIAVAKQKGFDGIVLDFEMSAIAFDEVVRHISSFEADFAEQVHESDMQFYPTVYGDVFYRLRPYDVGAIAKNSDGILIMAYDFHKAGGDPGPNFPLSGDDYNLGQMSMDFLSKTTADKLTVVFGMFGYDWKIDNRGQTVGNATAVTDAQAQVKFVNTCSLKDCQVKRDQFSGETEVVYTDSSGQKHEVWFEDQKSANAKIEYLKTRGIGSVGYWAYGYF